MLMGKRDRNFKAQYDSFIGHSSSKLYTNKLYTKINYRCGYIKGMMGVRIALSHEQVGVLYIKTRMDIKNAIYNSTYYKTRRGINR